LYLWGVFFSIFFQIFLNLTALSGDFKSFFDRHTQKNVCSVSIFDLNQRKVIFQHQQALLRVPASVTKIITTGAALSILGPTYRIETSVLYDGLRKGSQIIGDLIFRGQGDPKLVTELLWQLALDLKKLGLQEVNGDLVIDNDLFQPIFRTTSSNFLGRPFNAPVVPLSLNFNVLDFFVHPAFKSGNFALVQLYPFSLNYIHLKNKINTVNNRFNKKIKILKKYKNQMVLELSGSVHVKENPKHVYYSISRPVLFVGNLLRAFLAHQNIFIRGKIKAKKTHKKAIVLYKLKGYSLRNIVASMNYYSNNFIADMLTYQLAIYRHPQASQLNFVQGVNILKNFLKKTVGIHSSFRLLNGSGLSPKNRFSTAQMIQFLNFFFNDSAVFPDFLASFPASGWDGTLQKRFGKYPFLAGSIRAKTGTLTSPISASSLAGYFRGRNTHWYSFAFLCDGQKQSRQPSISSLRDFQESILAAFIDRSETF